jgi:hypothetical protein
MKQVDTNARIVFVFDNDVNNPVELAKERYRAAFEVLKQIEGYDGSTWNIVNARTEDVESLPNAELDVRAEDHGISDFKNKMYRSFQECERFENQGGLDKVMANF